MPKSRRTRSPGRKRAGSRQLKKTKLQRQIEARRTHLRMQLTKVQQRIREARRESNQAIRKVQRKYNGLLRGLERQGKKIELRFRLLANKTDLAFGDFRLGLSRAALDVNRAVKKAISEFRSAR